MPASTEDFLQEYQQTEAAYSQGNYEEAATLVYQLVENYPEHPSARLLCGHIYGYGLQQYEVAQEQYRAVLDLTDNPELIEQAHQAITETSQFLDNSGMFSGSLDPEMGAALTETDTANLDELGEDWSSLSADFQTPNPETTLEDSANLDPFEDLSQADLARASLDGQDLDLDQIDLSQTDLNAMAGDQDLDLDQIDLSQPDFALSNFDQDLDLGDLEEMPQAPSQQSETQLDEDLSANPFDDSSIASAPAAETEAPTELDSDPFNLDEAEELPTEMEEQLLQDLEDLSGHLFDEDSTAAIDPPSAASEETDSPLESSPPPPEQNGYASPASDSPVTEELDLEEFNSDLDEIFKSLEDSADLRMTSSVPPSEFHSHTNGKATTEPPREHSDFLSDSPEPETEAETLLMRPSEADVPSEITSAFSDQDLVFEDNHEISTDLPDAFSVEPEHLNGDRRDDVVFDADDIPDSFDLDAFDDSTVAEDIQDESTTPLEFDQEDITLAEEQEDLVTDSSALDDDDFLDNFEEFDDLDNLPDFEASREEESAFISDSSGLNNSDLQAFTNTATEQDNSAISNDELFNVPLDQEVVTTFTSGLDEQIETSLTMEQGPFAFLENAPLQTKFLYTAIGTGIATLILVATATNIATQTARLNQKTELVSALRSTGWVMTAVAGVTGFLTTWGLGNITARQMTKASDDLQRQFDAITRNNLKARATVYATDELGQMSSKFNYMAQFIETTTAEAQRKAEEQEEAKENLQRQVIRLLDDVEGAARGDLTVAAEVTADVLGAVADSFNLTIQNLREIVLQVKQAARQVSKGATDSSTFAKDVAGDALRQAEELAATLNSVQVLTDAIQRVADSAREAEEVARSAAAVATKGGESVQLTVAGILKIRETVAETSREVKRLAESSQEISKIVAIISSIASRTNLLALNASIEAARAGEAGRGFAIVADEVRQLADRSAKSLKEIEQIVMQIQSQTNSVMMAMEEGNQQVIEGTRLAEQAKRSLDDIIQVTNRIDVLVRSITADTVEQNETARAVAQVMQAVEHSAQETSQEAHRVSNALSNLVGVARDLLTSVERFRVDTSERK